MLVLLDRTGSHSYWRASYPVCPRWTLLFASCLMTLSLAHVRENMVFLSSGGGVLPLTRCPARARARGAPAAVLVPPVALQLTQRRGGGDRFSEASLSSLYTSSIP